VGEKDSQIRRSDTTGKIYDERELIRKCIAVSTASHWGSGTRVEMCIWDGICDL
jgi:hypothetical protein